MELKSSVPERADAACELAYGLSNGKLVHISVAANGIGCKCVCPSCGERLVARQGQKRAWHFAHASGAVCSTGPELALHMLAKGLFVPEEGQVVTVPLPVPDVYERGDDVPIESEWNIYRAEPEVAIADIRPDVVAWDRSVGRVFVEILVTHAVDEEKRGKLAGIGTPALEVDLSGVPRDITEDELRSLLFDGMSLYRWAYHPVIEAYVRRREEEAARWRAEELEARRRAAEAAAAGAARRRAAAQAARERAAADRERRRIAAREAEEARREAAEKARAAEAARREAAEKAMEETRLREREAYEARLRTQEAAVAERHRAWQSMTPWERLISNPRCYKCGSDMRQVARTGTTGTLWVCMGRCGLTWLADEADPDPDFKVSDRNLCPSCGKDLAVRNGRNGEFYGCTGYPACRYTRSCKDRS